MLGEFLVARDVISRDELDMALAVLPRFDGRIGDTLVSLGLVQPVHLFQHIATQVREKILDLFTWDAGTAEFYRGVASPQSRFPLAIDIWELLDEGAGRRLDAGLEEKRFAARMMDALQIAPQLPSYAQTDTLPANLQELILIVSRPLPLLEVVERLALANDERRGYRLVLLARMLELVQWVEP